MDYNENNININGLRLNDRAIEVLKELQVPTGGPAAMYVRTINEVVERLLLDEDGDPIQNLEHARALTLLKIDLQVISDPDDEDEEL